MTNPNQASMQALPPAPLADYIADHPVIPNFDHPKDWSPTSQMYICYTTVRVRRRILSEAVSVKVKIERTFSAPRVTVRAGWFVDVDRAAAAEKRVRKQLADGINSRWANYTARQVGEIVWPMGTDDGNVPMVPPSLPAPSPDLLYEWAQASARALP